MPENKKAQVERFLDDQEQKPVIVITLDDYQFIKITNGLFLELRRSVNQNAPILEDVEQTLALYRSLLPTLEEILEDTRKAKKEALEKATQAIERQEKIAAFEKFAQEPTDKAS